MKVLETERLLIRHFELGDLEAIHREVYSDPEVCHFFCRNTRTLEHTERWLRYRSYQSEHEQWGLMAVVPKETGEVVGLCGLQPYAGLWLSLESTPEDLRKYLRSRSSLPMRSAKPIGARGMPTKRVWR